MDDTKHTNLPTNQTLYQTVSVQADAESSMRSVLTILFRHKFYILGFFCITVTAVTVFTLLSPEIYQSNAKIFIQLGRESMSVDPSVSGPTALVRADRQSELNSEVSTIGSRILVEHVVHQIGAEAILKPVVNDLSDTDESQLADMGAGLLARLGLKKTLPAEEHAVTKVTDNLAVSAQKLSHIIDLSFQAESPELAQTVLQVLIDGYVDRHIEMHQMQAPLDFFEDRAGGLKVALEEKEGELIEFQQQHVMSSMEGQKAKVLEQVSVMQARIDQVAGAIAASNAKIDSITLELAGRSPQAELNRVVGRPNRTIEAIRDRLYELQTQEADLSARYLDSDRSLIDLREKIKLAERQLSEVGVTHTEVTHGVDTNYQSLQLSLANEQALLQAQHAQHKVLTTQLADRKASLLNISNQAISLNRIQREIGFATSEYQQYRESLQRAKISAELDSGKISNVSIVQPPTLSLIPIKPRKSLNIALGILLGLTGGLALAFLREYLNNAIMVPEDVEEKLGLPVLACISRKEFETCI